MNIVAKLYKETKDFSCISHPSIKIPFSAVNDDFCDCPDGSDEPGTAACAYLSVPSALTVADRRPGQDAVSTLPGYYCKNKGHRPSYIPFQRVNDGVCDYELCCDGSDEWARVGGTKCEDRCKSMGKEWRKREQKRKSALADALRARKDLLVKAEQQRKDIEDRIVGLEAEHTAQEAEVAAKEKELEAVQHEHEAEQNQKGMAIIKQAKERVEELRSALVQVRRQRDDARSQAKELMEIMTQLNAGKSDGSDEEAVKRALQRWVEYAARHPSGDEVAALERDLDAILLPDAEDWDRWKVEEVCENGNKNITSKHFFSFSFSLASS